MWCILITLTYRCTGLMCGGWFFFHLIISCRILLIVNKINDQDFNQYFLFPECNTSEIYKMFTVAFLEKFFWVDRNVLFFAILDEKKEGFYSYELCGGLFKNKIKKR